ncbi:MAG: SGNH/GDSL hydrolase family protein [Gammaproteobacteria bacterium]
MPARENNYEPTLRHQHRRRWRDQGWRLAALSLAPIILVQGLNVRRVTPRLPEANGQRWGTAGQGPRLRLLIAGDSAAAGVGATSQDEALAGAVVRDLGKSFSVHWVLDARNGRKTVDVLARMESMEAGPFDVALLSLGVNDVTGGTRSAVWVAQQRSLVKLLKRRFGVQHVLLTCLPPMHAFPALPQPLRWILGARARQFTALLRDLAATDPDCEVVTPDLPLDPAYMAADGFHPGPPAYAEWGREAAATIRRRYVAP